MILSTLTSSLEKAFLDEDISTFAPLTQARILKNERLSLQLLYTLSDDEGGFRRTVRPVVTGVPEACVTLRTVEHIPATLPTYPDRVDEGYLRVTSGVYPDLLQPLHSHGRLTVVHGQLRSLWIEIDPQGMLAAGDYTLTVSLRSESDEKLCAHTLTLRVLDVELPAQELIVTQWFHCDCLASYYDVPVFSERHWEIIEAFVKTAVRNGQTMLLTPTITPAFDTEIGGERPTVQLVDIAVENGEYRYGYDRLDRYIAMAQRCGISYFEMPPLFTQWGAKHAPKIMATVDGVERRIFGWETDAASEEYATFLVSFVSALITHLKTLGVDQRCYFHMSDEPNMEQLEQYKASQAGIRSCLAGYHTMDALSNYEFYKEGLIDTPVAATNHLAPFLEGQVPGLWCYYCCVQGRDVSNRFFSMPSARTRIIGMQMFKYGIAGFLHWGYNFYYNCHSIDLIDPYMETSGEGWVPSGDTFVVYPGPGGQPLESLRLSVFHEGLQDLRALKLCEQVYGHDATVAALERCDGEIRFDRCPTRATEMLALRDCVNDQIEQAIAEGKL